MNGKSNVDRLVDAGVLDPTNLDQAGYDAINNIDLTDEEIDKLKSFQQKLQLGPLPLQAPPEQQVHHGIWHL